MGLEAIYSGCASQKLAKPAFDGLLDTVSNRILSLALELREQLGTVDDKTEKLEPAGVDRSIVYHIYGGNDVIAANGGDRLRIIVPIQFVVRRVAEHNDRCIATTDRRLRLPSWRYDANSSSNAFASFRSRVSNPSVNHP